MRTKTGFVGARLQKNTGYLERKISIVKSRASINILSRRNMHRTNNVCKINAVIGQIIKTQSKSVFLPCNYSSPYNALYCFMDILELNFAHAHYARLPILAMCTRVIRQNVSHKFREHSMETPCWSPTSHVKTNNKHFRRGL